MYVENKSPKFLMAFIFSEAPKLVILPKKSSDKNHNYLEFLKTYAYFHMHSPHTSIIYLILLTTTHEPLYTFSHRIKNVPQRHLIQSPPCTLSPFPAGKSIRNFILPGSTHTCTRNKLQATRRRLCTLYFSS